MPETTGVLRDRTRTTQPVVRVETDRALFDRFLPNGVLWLTSTGLAHPEATRMTELPFVFAIGRLNRAGSVTTVREGPLVVAALRGQGCAESDLPAALAEYASAVVRLVPTLHARLNGRMCARFLAEREATAGALTEPPGVSA